MSAKTPSILVTDSRAQNQRKSPFPSSNVSPSPDVRDISLDTLLAGVDQVPSARRRIPLPNQSGKSRLQGQNVPQRMSKITQKLVLLPEHETLERPFDSDEDRPPHDYRLPSRSIAERLTKERREERSLPRVTAYCVSEAFRFQSTASFLRTKHDVVSRIYDEALYAAYHLPLLPGISGNRVKSSPEAKSSCGKYMDLQDDYEFTDTLITEGEISGMMQHAEMFVFSYGVVCFWNFSERQERNILADLTFALAGSLLVRPLLDKDVQTEDLHFEYSPTTQRPRIYNDMITLRSADHMIKLAMSHAIAQSVKMTVFEERMELTLQDTRHVPKELALTGELDMQRSQVLKMSGKLFKLRVDVNLSSNVLDTPDFFWDSEPTLHPLYTAVRDYLEIKSRIHALNEKCTVIFDLVDILSDSIADSTMHRITWIIIILVALSVIVTTLEVVFRFAILKRSGLDLFACSMLGVQG